jgi:hypothetical protein
MVKNKNPPNPTKVPRKSVKPIHKPESEQPDLLQIIGKGKSKGKAKQRLVGEQS